MDEQCVRSFWQQHPCGDAQVGGLDDRFGGDYERFFTDYDRFRYRNERHLPGCLARLNVEGRRVLEVRLGEGADAELLIRRGARCCRAQTGRSPAGWMIAAARLSERRLGSWVGRGVRTGVAACQPAAH